MRDTLWNETLYTAPYNKTIKSTLKVEFFYDFVWFLPCITYTPPGPSKTGKYVQACFCIPYKIIIIQRQLLSQFRVVLDLNGIREWDIFAHVPGMLVPGLETIYGAAHHKIAGLTTADLADSSTVKVKKFDYILSKAKVIHLSDGNGGDGR